MEEERHRLRLAAGVAWAALSACAVSAIVTGRVGLGLWLVVPGSLLGFAAPERDAAGWRPFLAASLNRIADAALAASLAWAAVDAGSVSGASAAAALLACVLLAPYVRTRAVALGIPSARLVSGTSSERGIGLLLVALAVWAGAYDEDAMATLLWIAAAYPASLVVARFVRIWVGASRG